MLQVRGTTVRTHKGQLWRPDAPPFRQFRATASIGHTKYAIPKDPAQVNNHKAYVPGVKDGAYYRGPGKGRPAESPEGPLDKDTHTIVKLQSFILCHPRKNNVEESCIRMAFIEKVAGWPLHPKYVGLAYLYIDEKGSSVFDSDQHKENCSCTKKQGPQPEMWNKAEEGVTQVLNISQSATQTNCFQPLKPEDYVELGPAEGD